MVVINTLFPPKVYFMIIILGLFEWCQIARITRAETLSLKERDFVLAAKHLGARHWQIIFGHIIPNMSSSIIVAGSLAVARAILTESALSFMGIGVQLPKASWGTMLQGAQTYIMDVPTLAVFPGIFIVLTVFSFNILGDALQNALEPKKNEVVGGSGMEKILEIQDLRVSYHTYAGEVQSVRGVSFSIEKGETLAIVGESGCGKSVTAKTIMGLVMTPPGEIKEGSQVIYRDKNILEQSEKEWEKYRGAKCSMIFSRCPDGIESDNEYWQTDYGKYHKSL